MKTKSTTKITKPTNAPAAPKHEQLEAAAPVEQPTPEQPAAPETAPEKASAKHAWSGRARARRGLAYAIARLGKHDFAAFGVDVAPALDILRTEASKMGGPAKREHIAVGASVRLKAKTASRYSGIVEPTDVLTVLALDKKGCRATLADGTRVALPVVHVELASA